MKKILLAFDGDNFWASWLKFAGKLNKKKPLMLTAAFLPQDEHQNLLSNTEAPSPGSVLIHLPEDEQTNPIKEKTRTFRLFNHTNNIPFKLHTSVFNFALPELKTEARHTDVLPLGSHEFYMPAGNEVSNLLLREILHHRGMSRADDS